MLSACVLPQFFSERNLCKMKYMYIHLCFFNQTDLIMTAVLFNYILSINKMKSGKYIVLSKCSEGLLGVRDVNYEHETY